jgi:hypothetical protein
MPIPATNVKGWQVLLQEFRYLHSCDDDWAAEEMLTLVK